MKTKWLIKLEIQLIVTNSIFLKSVLKVIASIIFTPSVTQKYLATEEFLVAAIGTQLSFNETLMWEMCHR